MLSHCLQNSEFLRSTNAVPKSRSSEDCFRDHSNDLQGSFSGPSPPIQNRHSQILQQPHFSRNNQKNRLDNIPTQVSSSRALSNHILWRTAYRREHQHQSASQFDFRQGTGFPRNATLNEIEEGIIIHITAQIHIQY